MNTDEILAICQSTSGGPVRTAMQDLSLGKCGGEILLKSQNQKTEDYLCRQLAADQIVHLIEGWLNYSSAVTSLLYKSSSQAFHMAYYAELRAALSLFAWSGIAVKKKDGFYIDNCGHCKVIHIDNTHSFVWNLWKQWVRQDYASDLLLDGIKFTPGVTLRRVKELTSIPFISPNLLMSWGYDLLHNLRSDQRQRNIASYGTSSLVNKKVSRIQTISCDFFFQIWDLLLKFDGNTLNFDIYFVKYLLSSLEGVDSEAICNRIINQYPDCIAYLAVKEGAVNTIFQNALKKDYRVECILSRALIILRYATLAAAEGLICADGLKMWLKKWLCSSEKNELFDEDFVSDCQLAKDELLEMGFKDEPIGKMLNKNALPEILKLTRPAVCLSWGLPL